MATQVVVVAAGTIAVGVAINQILNNGSWSWWWLASASVLAIAAQGVNQWLSIHDRPSPPTESGEPLDQRQVIPLTGAFVGRRDELAELDAALRGPGPGVVAVHGLGGIGKSTLAARYADKHRKKFRPVWWITADTPTAVEAGLAGLASALFPESSKG